MSDETKDTPATNRPIETLRDGPLSASIFKNQGEKGEYFSVVPRKIYTNDQGEVKESKSLTGSEPIRQGNLLTTAGNRVLEHMAQLKADKSRDTDRER